MEQHFGSAHFRGVIVEFRKRQESVATPLLRTSEDDFFAHCQTHLLRLTANVHSLFYTEFLLATPGSHFHRFCEHVMDFALAERFYYFSFWNGIITQSRAGFLQFLICASIHRALHFVLAVNQVLVHGSHGVLNSATGSTPGPLLSATASANAEAPLSHFSTMKDVKPFEEGTLEGGGVPLVDILSPNELATNMGAILPSTYALSEVFHNLKAFLFHLYRHLLKQIGHYAYIYPDIVRTASLTKDVI